MLNPAVGSLLHTLASSGGTHTSAPVMYAFWCQKCLSVRGRRAHTSSSQAAYNDSANLSSCQESVYKVRSLLHTLASSDGTRTSAPVMYAF